MKKRVRLTKIVKQWKRPLSGAVLVVLGGGIFLYAGYMNNKQVYIDPARYRPLLNLIARVESRDNYNAYFSNAANTTIDFTAMSVGEVLDWQTEFVRQGNPSSAVGRYQIIRPTLAGLVRQLDIDMNQKFDRELQDRMAIALLERRGSRAFMTENMSREQFAANLAKEWAALPRVTGNNPEESYYAADGLNRSLVAVDEVLAVIDQTSGDI